MNITPFPTRPRKNPNWLLRLARWIGKLRYNRKRAKELESQNFSRKAIKGLLG